MTPVRVSTLSSVIFIVILKSCVRADNYYKINLKPVEPIYVNSNQNLPFYIQSSLLAHRLCITIQWHDCVAILTNGANGKVRDTKVRSHYQTGHYQGGSSQKPEIKKRTNQVHRPQPFGKQIRNTRRHGSHNLPTAVRNYSSYNVIPINAYYTQPENEPTNRIPQSKGNANITHDLNDVQNLSIIVKETDEDLTTTVQSVEDGTQTSDVDTTEYFENTVTTESPATDTSMPITRGMDNEATLYQHNNNTLFYKFTQTLDKFERKFYMATFNRLSSISPVERRENGISFIQSGLLLHLMLTALSLEVDPETKLEIDKSIGLIASDAEKIQIVKQVMSSLPISSDELKFLMTSRLVMAKNVSLALQSEVASSIRLRLDRINVTDTPEVLARTLNDMIEEDSGGAMRHTFEENDLTESVHAMLMSTVYVRARWRSAPTLLNGTRTFRDADGAPPHSVRMIRINDIMQYADLREWDAEALEISYATPDLSLLLLVPRGRSLRQLAMRVSATSLKNITDLMQTMRVAVSLPLYTLRMTLLLPNKLEFMGMSRIMDTTDETSNGTLRLSHAIQRLMFWAEAGRNAFKDDGIEWDEHPELELVVDKPYMFFVRWRNLTLINGNFVN